MFAVIALVYQIYCFLELTNLGSSTIQRWEDRKLNLLMQFNEDTELTPAF